MKRKLLEIDSIEDIAMIQMMIILLAFKDFTFLTILSQCVAFFVIFGLKVVKRKKVSKSCFDYSMNKLSFIFICFLGVFWSFNEKNITGIVITLMLRFITGLTIITYVDSKNKVDKLVKYMCISAFVLCARMLICIPTSAWGTERVGKYLSHDVKNGYGNTGITYILGLVGIYVLTCSEQVIKNSKIKVFIYIVFVVFSLMSGSKKQIILTLVTIVLLAILKSKSIVKTIKNIIIAGIIIAIVIFSLLNIKPLYNAIGHRMLSFLSYSTMDIEGVEADASTITRNQFMEDSWNQFTKHPFWGIGIDGYRYVNSYQRGTWAENNFLELLADTGIVGFVIYYYIYIGIMWSVLKKLKYKRLVDIQSFIIFVALMIIDFTMVSYSNNTLQIFMAVLYGVNKNSYEIEDDKE